MEDIIACLGDVVAVLPSVRRFALTDSNRIFFDAVGVMYIETQTVYTVAAVNTRHHKAIFARGAQYLCRVFRTAVLGPLVQPGEWSHRIRYMYRAVGNRNAVTHSQIQGDDTVATVNGQHRIAIDTRFLEILNLGGVVVHFKPVTVECQRVARTDGIEQQCVADDAVAYAQVVNAIMRVRRSFRTQRVIVMTPYRIFCAYGEALFIAVGPGMCQRRVLMGTYINRVTPVINGIDNQMERISQLTGDRIGVLLPCRTDRVISARLVTPHAAPPYRIAYHDMRRSIFLLRMNELDSPADYTVA